MKIRNNNQRVIQRLAKAEYHANRSRNYFMILSIAVTMIVVFCIFSVMKGRIDAEYLMEVRHNGNTANTSLENPTEKQIQQICELSYIKNVGKVYHFANARVEGRDCFSCEVTDENAYKTIYLPAFSDIVGNYPRKKNEVMISIRGLQEIGISKPTLGMNINVEIVLDKDKIEKKTFLLSGYYTEYVNPIEAPPIGFFSEKYLNELGFTMKTPTKLFIQQRELYTGEAVEKRLYKDVETKNEVQRFESEDSVNYNVIVRTMGGYDIAAAGIVLVFIGVFFLNYNVLNISINKDVQYYGMLKTIGATNRQIRLTLYRQALKNSLTGCLIGGGISSVIVAGLLPKLMSGYCLDNFGVSSDMIQFHLDLFLASIFVPVVLSFVSILIPAFKAGKIAPIESVHYVEEQKIKSRKFGIKNNKNRISYMAWKNVIRNKRSAFITIISLCIGLIAALASILITKGLDYTNNFAMNPDFSLTSFLSPVDENYNESYWPITQEEEEYFEELDGVKKVDTLYGNYIYLSPDAQIWQTYLKGYENVFLRDAGEKMRKEQMDNVKKEFSTTVFLADKEFIEDLNVYDEKNKLEIDMESFVKGEGVLCVDGDFFSEKLEKSSQKYIGEKFEMYNRDGNTIGEMKFAGNLNLTKKGCPTFRRLLKLYGPDLIMTQEAFERLGIEQRALNVDIYVQEEKETRIKEKIQHYIEEKRQQIPPSEDSKIPYLRINSDDLKAAQDEIKTMKIAMYTISILMTALGILNYFNTTVAGLWGRRREFAMMEAIGITRKQLRKMLMWEGIYYSVLISGLIITAGSGILYGVFQIVHSRLRYAKFYYPSIPLIGMLVVMFVICIETPCYVYKKVTKESVIERLHKSRE